MVEGVQRVVILAGGPSPEAAVSRMTAAGMFQACGELGLAAEIWELEGDWLARLVALPKEGLFVLIGLHGCPGEDGSVQAVLDLLGVPYQGSGVAACAFGMDKIRSRILFEQAGISVAPGLWGEALDDAAQVAHFFDVHGKVVVKPSEAGSAIGVSIIDKLSQWPAAYRLAASYGAVLLEAYIPGFELTVAVCGREAWPTLVIEVAGTAFYDYQAKYSPGGSAHVQATQIPPDVEMRAREQAVLAATAVGTSGVCRVDLRYDPVRNQLMVLEVNTLPGMTPTSLVPDAARLIGLSYTDVVRQMINDGEQRWLQRRSLA